MYAKVAHEVFRCSVRISHVYVLCDNVI